MAIELIAKVVPKNDGFTGMVDADQVLGGGGSGTLPAACIADDTITYAKMQDASANVVLGSVAGGTVEEISCTAAGRALLDDADAAAQLTTLGAASDAELLTHKLDATTHGCAGDIVGDSDVVTLWNKTLVTPTIASFTNATHDHADAAGGGELEIVKDLSPQLGADLDLNTHSLLGDGDTKITETADESITLDHCRSFIVQKDEVDGYTGGPYMRVYAAGPTSGAGFVGRRSRGTLASPTACVDGDVLFRFNSGGYTNATTQKYRGTIDFVVDGTVTATSLPTKISFLTGSNASRVERLRIQSDGHIRITNAASRLQFGATTDFIQNYSSSLAFFGNTSIRNYVAAGLQVDVGVGSMTFRVSDHTSLDFNTAKRLHLQSETNTRLTIDDTGWSVMGHATAATGAVWTIINRTTDREVDCNTVAVAELADALATLIEELETHGVVSANVS